jgi:hypothetical protein
MPPAARVRDLREAFGESAIRKDRGTCMPGPDTLQSARMSPRAPKNYAAHRSLLDTAFLKA